MLALVAVVLGPMRTGAIKDGFRHLERIYLESRALSAARADAHNAVFRRSALHDQRRLTQAAAHLVDAEEAAQRRLRDQLDNDIRIRLDGGLRRLKRALEPVIKRDPAFADREHARAQLASARRRLGAAVADDLRALSRCFDSPTGVRLIAATTTGPFEIDIDANRTRRLRPAGLDRDRGMSLFRREGWFLALGEQGVALALSGDLQTATTTPGTPLDPP